MMNETQLETPRIYDLFSDALEVPEAQRGDFLKRSCGEDDELRRAVDGLLAAHQKAGQFLADPTLAAESAAMPRNGAAARRIGPYTLHRIIGEGGYGTVFLAQQDQPLRRQVAVKVIKAGMDTRQVIARFDMERQALAMMDHPNIARVYDAGSTEAGRPYFVMELVEGQPFTEYCRSNRLGIRRRLELFMGVCSAVQHAHQKGIIHHDIKPSNVLVAARDGAGVPKVIDFGIAKALHAPDGDRGTVTEEAQLIGTPQYMSPEQASGRPGGIDTRSDIYSLGVLLYEVLTDAPPFERDQLRSAAYAEMQRIIREVDPPTPSSRLMTLERSLPQNQPERRTQVRRFAGQVRGDLDWIVMRAMGKAYRLRKFARRNRWLLAPLAAVAAALLIGLAGTTVGLVRARTERDAARAARDAAQTAQAAEASARKTADEQRAAAKASEARAKEQAGKLWIASLFLHRLLAPTAEPSDIPPPRDFLDFADMRANDGFLKGHPDTEVPIRDALGESYLHHADWMAGEQQYRLALEKCLELPAAEQVDAPTYENSIGICLMHEGKYDVAERMYRHALDIYRQRSKPKHVGIVEINLGADLAAQGDFDNALVMFGDARIINRRSTPPDTLDVLRILDGLVSEREQAGESDAPALRDIANRLRAKLGTTN
jgi:serine/threonine protein kinase